MRLVLDYGGTVVEHVDESEYSRVLGDDASIPGAGYIAYKAFSLGIIDSEEDYISALSALTGTEAETCRDYLAERKFAADLPDGREPLLRGLARDHELVLFTDQVRPWVEETLEAHGIGDVFDDLVVSNELGEEKPHPSGYVEALGDAEPEDAVMVSDELNDDLLMADYFGMTTVWIENDHEDVHVAPDFRVTDLDELPAVLDDVRTSGAR